MLSPVIRTGTDPRSLFIFTPQGRKLFLFDLKIGMNPERQQAQEAESKVKETMALVNKYAGDKKGYRSFDKPEVIAKMRAELAHVPKVALDKFIKRAQRAPKDIRAQRKVSSRSFANEVAGIREALVKGLKASSDLAATLSIKHEISMPAMIHDTIADDALSRVYVGLWDQTIRCYDIASGKELWSTPVIGGNKLSLSGKNLYAGGTRGDVYQINTNDGRIKWHKNITAATNKLD
jgi:hypothetical protein